MADMTFNTTAGATIDRELLIAYMNTGTSGSPTWSPLGSRVTDSSEEFDWSEETNTDILGITRNVLKKPVISQTFEPLDLSNGDTAATKIWNMAVKDQDYAALSTVDMLIVHHYAGTRDTAVFAERYTGCSVRPTGLGGAGGGNVGMPLEVTYGGTRSVGTASVSAGGVVSFSAA